MPDVMTYACSGLYFGGVNQGYPSGIGINNGGIVCSARETGAYSRRDRDFNNGSGPSYRNDIPSGIQISRLDSRFDSMYGGPPSGINGL